MGTSSRTQDPVSAMIQHALWPTLQLLFWATLFSVILALALGVYSAVKQYSIGDYVFTGLSYLGIAMPDFWFALLAIGLPRDRAEGLVPSRPRRSSIRSGCTPRA